MLTNSILTPEEQNSLNQRFLDACNGYKYNDTDNAEVEKLLAEGAKITAVDPEGNTALHIACRYHSHFLVAMLLQKGCNPSQPNDNGKLPFDKIPKMKNESSGRYSWQVYNTMDLILSAEEWSTPHSSSDIFKARYKINSPLQLAFLYGCKKAIKVQLDKRMNIDHVRVCGLPLLVYILNEKVRLWSNDSLFSQDEIIEIALCLIDKLNSINTVNDDKKNPLQLAAIIGSDEVCKKIIEKEPGLLKVIDKQGRTPIWYAAFNGHESIVLSMLEHGSDPIDVDEHTCYFVSQPVITKLKPEILTLMQEARKLQMSTQTNHS